MPSMCVTCHKPEVFLVIEGRRLSNLRQGEQGLLCAFCFFAPEINLERRLTLSIELHKRMEDMK